MIRKKSVGDPIGGPRDRFTEIVAFHGGRIPPPLPPHLHLAGRERSSVTPSKEAGTSRRAVAACIVHVHTYMHYTLHSDSFLRITHVYIYKKNIYI